MPIISQQAARTLKGRFAHALILLTLTLGSITILYPFALMVSGSLKSEMDENDLNLVPTYLYQSAELYQKFLETKYGQRIDLLNQAHLTNHIKFRQAQTPLPNEALANEYAAFLKESSMPREWLVLGGVTGLKTVPNNLRRLRDDLKNQFHGDLEAFNRETGGVAATWLNITVPQPDPLSQRYDYPNNAVGDAYFETQSSTPLGELYAISPTGFFLDRMVYPRFGRYDTTAFAEALGRDLRSFESFRLEQTYPSDGSEAYQALWIEFVLEELNASYVLTQNVSPQSYQEFLQATYASIVQLNEAWGTDLKSFGEITHPENEWLSGARRTDYNSFLKTLSPTKLRLAGPEFRWRDWLHRQYGSLSEINSQLNTTYTSMDAIYPPSAELEWQFIQSNSSTLKKDFAVRNFVNVIDELFVEGRPFLNTVIFCSLSVLSALIINPLTAYAMSRFQLPGSYKILLLLMATMAFPPMVTLIPTFLILQKLNMMNTFAALVLPTIANGYLIFLLKGFFDSLPKELYEAASIDGASEMRIFFQITLALSKPILAVVALSAFNSAYTMFLYPLLVAPDPQMWLLSVWLYQFQLEASTGGIFASVLIAAIPTLLLFIFCQRIIMRGIVVPVEK
ncbi:carbohydrate ABC transporter permease [Cerasicoccus maritimus]|uniref:carbohydrate ABC transporter permease n=1 Tax=Cerasicoccus maritimus TaxID=490089 RepID=UPI002852C607|nr:carbohydrate ABC transporter permease [Cerasicoccus maritimus]